VSGSSSVGSAAATSTAPGELSGGIGAASDTGIIPVLGWVTGMTSTVLSCSLFKAGVEMGCTDEFAAESTGGCSGFDIDAVAEGSGESLGALIGAPDSFDGPAGSGMDSAASRAGDSATGLGIAWSRVV
jgi:hypothetical protein